MYISAILLTAMVLGDDNLVRPATSKPTSQPAPLVRDKSAAQKLRWKLGCQAYTFHHLTAFEAIDYIATLDLDYIEFYPGQQLSRKTGAAKLDHGMSDENLALLQKKLKSVNMPALHYGVAGLAEKEAENRKVFEFAKKLGATTIVSEPAGNCAELLDKLAAEYGINVAIHNHPKPSSRFWDPQTVVKFCEGRSNRIGDCADVGHWMRSGLNSVECLKKVEGKITCLHFKDLSDATPGAHDVPWGSGKSDASAMLAELKRQGGAYEFSAEYEHITPELMSNLRKCVEWFDSECAKLTKE